MKGRKKEEVVKKSNLITRTSGLPSMKHAIFSCLQKEISALSRDFFAHFVADLLNLPLRL